jgi:hypothetical protein
VSKIVRGTMLSKNFLSKIFPSKIMLSKITRGSVLRAYGEEGAFEDVSIVNRTPYSGHSAF